MVFQIDYTSNNSNWLFGEEALTYFLEGFDDTDLLYGGNLKEGIHGYSYTGSYIQKQDFNDSLFYDDSLDNSSTTDLLINITSNCGVYGKNGNDSLLKNPGNDQLFKSYSKYPVHLAKATAKQLEAIIKEQYWRKHGYWVID